MSDSAVLARLVDRARNARLPLAEQHTAFARLVEHTQHLAFGLALSRLRDVDDAQDAAQEAFATAWLRLPQLREAAAFAGWIKTIVVRSCTRRSRRRTRRAMPLEPPRASEDDGGRLDYQSLIAAALAALPQRERDVTVLFYFLGYRQPEIARLLRLKPGTVAKRLHAARLRIRRGLPRSVRRDFVRLAASPSFVQRVRRGLLDEYVGEYRFDSRPDQIVSIYREGDALVSLAAGQRTLLVSVAEDTLVTEEFDGEGRFRRDRRGAVTHFVYYEFGRRLGVARKQR